MSHSTAPFEMVDSIAALRMRLVGRALAGQSFVTWCASPRLVGTVHFGVRSVEDSRMLAQLYSLVSHPELRGPLRRVVDGRSFESIPDDAWDLLSREASPRLETARALFERQAIIVSPGAAGVQRAALLGAGGPGDAFRVFTEAKQAYAWADPDDGPATFERVEQLVRACVGRDTAARARAWIAAHLRDADVRRCARSLGMSGRSLQRALSREGSSFRSLFAEERVRAAQALLSSRDTKVETVARQVGASSASHLAELLRRAGHPPPRAHRR